LEGDSQSTVVAGVRNPDTAVQLADLLANHSGRLHVIKLDVSDPDSIKVTSTTILRLRLRLRLIMIIKILTIVIIVITIIIIIILVIVMIIVS
jgi:NAD(P)-dependent dehydrogenase (short-subunit alcohol dehydrogenase family)